MSTMTVAQGSRGGKSSSLYDVLELILDKGLVIDAFVRVSLVGIELLTVDARIVVASVDTYLRFAEAANRLDLQAANDSKGLPQLLGDVTSGAAQSKTRGALSGARDVASEWLGERSGDGEDEDGEQSRGDAQENERQDGRRARRARRARRSSAADEGEGAGAEDQED